MTEWQKIATKLAPDPVTSVHEINRGGNSRIYKVETTGDVYALKCYPLPGPQDPRGRLSVEWAALRFLHDHGITNVPRAVAMDAPHGMALLSWCDGAPISDMRDDYIPQFAAFLTRLAEASSNAAEEMPLASEACISGARILSHITGRVEKLRVAAVAQPDLKQFLEQDFLPAIEKAEGRARQIYAGAGLDFDDDIAPETRVLIPSDFGTHNALETAKGLVFLDFEYFGWDDPATSTANFILHPAMTLTDAQQQEFCRAMREYFAPRDPHYALRLEALLPLYAARWAAIILGEFIPERWAHRVLNNVYREDEKDAVLARQLAKARGLVTAPSPF